MAFDLVDFRGVGDGVTMNTEAIKDYFFKKILFNIDVKVHMEWK